MTHKLPELRLGPVRIEFPAVLAALSGYSDWPTRVISRRLGAAYTICEVLLDQFVLNVTKGAIWLREAALPDGVAISPMDPRWMVPPPMPEKIEIPRPKIPREQQQEQPQEQAQQRPGNPGSLAGVGGQDEGEADDTR